MLTGRLRHKEAGMLQASQHLRRILPAISKGNLESLRPFHYKSLMIGMMHFMDSYNFDLERVQRCCIHYGFPGGKIVPFCTMNTLHRRDVELLHAQPLSADNVTSLYDVQSLTNKILEDEQGPDLVLAEHVLHTLGSDTHT